MSKVKYVQTLPPGSAWYSSVTCESVPGPQPGEICEVVGEAVEIDSYGYSTPVYFLKGYSLDEGYAKQYFRELASIEELEAYREEVLKHFPAMAPQEATI